MLPRLFLAGAVLLLLLLTKPESYGDTTVYVGDIVLASKRNFGPGQNPLWEFGHLLWRPIGSWLWLSIDGISALRERWNETQRAYLPLVAISIVSGVFGVGLMYAIARRFVGDTWRAAVAGGGLLASHAYLDYWQSGTAYIPGLACILASVYFADGARRSGNWIRPVVFAGVFLALGILLWVPYIVAAPAIALLLLLPLPDTNEPRPTWFERLKPAGALALITLLIGIAAYASAAKANHISSAKAFIEWAGQSSHGVEQTKRLLRLPTALPRTLVHVGEDGMMVKRFVFKDPYAPVSLFDLLRLSILKMIAFYGAAALLIYALYRRKQGRWALALLSLAALVNVFFAVAVFEPSQMERYLPTYPFLWLGVAIALETGGWIGWTLCAAVALMSMNNIHAMSPRTHGSLDKSTFARRASLGNLPPSSQIVVLNFKDELWRQQYRLPFHSEMRTSLPLYDVLETGTAQAGETWRRNWAEECLRSFEKAGEVWISERVFQDRPLPDWKWVEGDQPGVVWSDFPAFFRNFEYGEHRGGEDGFRQLLPSQANLEKLRTFNAAPRSGE